MSFFRILVEHQGSRTLLRVTAHDVAVGDLHLWEPSATALLEALKAGHVGPEGSGADVEIVEVSERKERRE